MIPETPESIKKVFDQIFLKDSKGEKLSLVKEEILGLWKLREIQDIHKLEEQKFPNYKFRHLYLIYSPDLSFKGKYFKPNFEVKSSEIFDYKKIQAINQQEFNQDTFDEMERMQRAFNVEIEIEKKEISDDKNNLEKVAKDWATQMLIENHTDQNLVRISKETRDTIKKKNIEDYLKGVLSSQQSTDIFKALLKSKYIHNEALKLLDKIGKNGVVLKLDGVEVYYNYSSITHILNRHYAQLVSNEMISQSKTFHSPKISPYKLHHTLQYIFHKINAKKALVGNIKDGVPIFLKYKGDHYALYLKVDKLNKNRLYINTFYQIDENTAYGKNDMVRIKTGKYVVLSSNLGIYKNFS